MMMIVFFTTFDVDTAVVWKDNQRHVGELELHQGQRQLSCMQQLEG
jgi:hypothetical protein